MSWLCSSTSCCSASRSSSLTPHCSTRSRSCCWPLRRRSPSIDWRTCTPSATRDGLLVTNYLKSRRLEWSEIVGVRLAPGDPWVQLDVSDGGTLAVMAIQTADGDRGRAMALELANAVATYGASAASAEA